VPGSAGGWNLVESRADFEAIAAGAAPAPAGLVGVARASPTLQNDRLRQGGDPSRPFGDAEPSP
jgi:hypothetical protein